jgi:hypothetical protein
MKTYLLFFLILIYYNATAQDEVTRAANAACGCLKEIDPTHFTERELKVEILGCVSRQVDVVAEELTKNGTWADSLAFQYLGKIGKEARGLCPEAYARLKKKEIEVDPAILKIPANAETLPGFSQAVCRCMEVAKDLDACVKKVGQANEEELTKRFPGDPMAGMMQLGTELLFDLADHCEAAASNETVAVIKKVPPLKDACDKIVLGEFKTETMLGETRSLFTAKGLKEFSDGKLSAEYELKWDKCIVTLKCISSNSKLVNKGDVSTMEIKRGSADVFIAFVSLGKMKVPVKYEKVK